MAIPFYLNCILLKKPKPKTVAEGDAAILAVKTKLEKLPYAVYSQELLNLIEQRRQDYKFKIESIEKKADQQIYIVAYNHFAQNIRRYIDKPTHLYEKMNEYHNSNDYCHVGRVFADGKQDVSYYLADEMAKHLIKLGILAVIISVIALPFHLPLSLIVMSIGLCAMLPGFFYNISITDPKERYIKEVELNLFGEAHRVIDAAAIHKYNPEEYEQPQNMNFP